MSSGSGVRIPRHTGVHAAKERVYHITVAHPSATVAAALPSPQNKLFRETEL